MKTTKKGISMTLSSFILMWFVMGCGGAVDVFNDIVDPPIDDIFLHDSYQLEDMTDAGKVSLEKDMVSYVQQSLGMIIEFCANVDYLDSDLEGAPKEGSTPSRYLDFVCYGVEDDHRFGFRLKPYGKVTQLNRGDPGITEGHYQIEMKVYIPDTADEDGRAVFKYYETTTFQWFDVLKPGPEDES